jgi:ParB family transcriptional regulator, chromosome partitioning protein
LKERSSSLSAPEVAQTETNPTDITLGQKTAPGKSIEWYTPEMYVAAVREVLGHIDLDPASCSLANVVVQADIYYTQQDNGLVQPWYGKIFLNPPYGNIAEHFIEKLLSEFHAGHVTEAVLVLNGASVIERYQSLLSYQVCHPRYRPKFWSANGVGESPMYLTAFVYIGPNRDRFRSVFRKFGKITVEDTDETEEPLAA